MTLKLEFPRNVVVGNENILGSLHADVEPKTIKDFETAMKIWGNYSWSPRAVLVYMPNGKDCSFDA